jgi:hypothetical protein
MFLNLMAKGVWVVFHPNEQGGSALVRVGASGRAGLDPLADEIPVELPEPAAGVIEFIGLGTAARKKSPTQRDGAGRLGCNEHIDGCGDLFKPAHKRGALTIANQRPRAEGGLDLPLDWICLAA